MATCRSNVLDESWMESQARTWVRGGREGEEAERKERKKKRKNGSETEK